MERELKFRMWDVGRQEMEYGIEAGYAVINNTGNIAKL